IGLPGLSSVSGAKVRMMSPAALSTLITSAPQSAISPAQPGPATQVDHSTTFRSDNSIGDSRQRKRAEPGGPAPIPYPDWAGLEVHVAHAAGHAAARGAAGVLLRRL